MARPEYTPGAIPVRGARERAYWLWLAEFQRRSRAGPAERRGEMDTKKVAVVTFQDDAPGDGFDDWADWPDDDEPAGEAGPR